MIKIGCSLAFLFLFLGCNEAKKQAVTAAIDTPPAELTALVEERPAFPLMDKYDCKSCHRADEKLQGPSYLDIAAKYAGQAKADKYLSGKIITGGSGVWGSLPMNAHAGMPEEDATKMATYILQLKK